MKISSNGDAPKITKHNQRQKSDIKTMMTVFNFVKYLSTMMHNFLLLPAALQS